MSFVSRKSIERFCLIVSWMQIYRYTVFWRFGLRMQRDVGPINVLTLYSRTFAEHSVYCSKQIVLNSNGVHPVASIPLNLKSKSSPSPPPPVSGSRPLLLALISSHYFPFHPPFFAPPFSLPPFSVVYLLSFCVPSFPSRCQVKNRRAVWCTPLTKLPLSIFYWRKLRLLGIIITFIHHKGRT